jgi:hypothetical protein
MDVQTLKAIAEMIRLAARAQGAELTDIDVTICRSVDPATLLKEGEDGEAK